MKTFTTFTLSVLMSLAIQKQPDAQTTLASYSPTVVRHLSTLPRRGAMRKVNYQTWIGLDQPLHIHAKEQRPGLLNAIKAFNPHQKQTNEWQEIRDELVLRSTRTMRTPHETVTKRLYA